MILQTITLARSWHLLVRIGIVTIAVGAATALQLPVEIEVPSEPFLLNFIVVVVSACTFGRTPGFVAAAESTIASVLYFEPLFSFRLTHAIDLLVIEIYAAIAALSVEAICRLVDSALAEKSAASSAHTQRKEVEARLADREAQLAWARTLAESEARFRATFENAAVGIEHVAPDGRWLRVNEAFCRFLGYPADELVTKSFQNLTHPDDLAADLAQAELMRKGKIDAYDLEKRYLRKDGTIVWGRKTVSSVRRGDGSIDFFVTVVQDISARKAREAQVQLLMREVTHRAKNMLCLVQAIARQTATREPEDFVERFAERVRSLAANQDLLVRNEWQGVDVEDLVRAQLAHFADLVGSRITVHGSPVRLNAAAAQAIGLALHELATNAGKYGALSVNAGRVDVGWRLDGDIFAMSWTESKGPPVSQPKRQGFGSTVIDSMAKRTLDGEVQLDYAPSGLVWTCSAANALEREENHERNYSLEGRQHPSSWSDQNGRSAASDYPRWAQVSVP
jgi:PAS domain S-box-containing protein